MKKGIVLKLFFLTTMLCVLILAAIFVGQTIFFKQFYVEKKVEELKADLTVFEKEYKKNSNNISAIQQLERDFSEDNNAWITILDQNGLLKYENDFFMEVQLYEHYHDIKTIKIPLYLIDQETTQLSESLAITREVNVMGILKEAQLIPINIRVKNGYTWDYPLIFKNEQFNKQFDEFVFIDNSTDLVSISGQIINVKFPESNNLSSVIYSNSLFLEQINAFQTKLLLNEAEYNSTTTEQVNFEQNNIQYNISIKPVANPDGTNSYIFSMASLQPVDEAVQMIEEYYIYMVAFVSILIILASFYYSTKIARPLLRINHTTEKIANLDFSETIVIDSNDEIGDLSRNINLLSHKLSMYIEQLQQDIEKEKKLENTRKEFISGVSHELKTPLSIMKSCITILRGNVANHKKEYYFDALEEEVDKMNLMIVDMLELAKYESGTYKMQMDDFYIHTLMEEIQQKLISEIEQKKLKIETYLTPVKVLANQRRIEQVLTNFLINAIRYSPAQERIIMKTEVEGDLVKVSVENTGTHIAEEHLEKVWDRFYRIDASRKRADGGTGLGLAISKNILILHGVEFGVCNTEKGVQFYFYLHIKE